VDRIEILVSEQSDRPDETPESASDSSILGNIKHPVSSAGRVTRQGDAQGVGKTGEIADGGPPVQVSGVVTADSSLTTGSSADGGASYLNAEGSIEPQRATTEDVDRRRQRRSEYFVGFWFMVSVLGTLGFVVTDLIGNTHKQYYTPLLGTFMALAVGGLGIGLIHWAKQLMGDEEAVQEREHHGASPEEIEATERVFAKGVDTSGILRRPIVRRSLLLASGALGLLGIVPILNLGPMPGRRPKAFGQTSWRFTTPMVDGDGKKIQGIRMIDQTGRAIKLGDISAGGLLTVFPGIAAQEFKAKPGFYPEPSLQVKGNSTVLLIRLRPGDLRGSAKVNTYFDHIAFSKICTHAGCPVSLYEQQTHHLLCPCHQSIFDVTDHGRPIFGPSARPLPQLAITIDAEGYFIAKGDFNQPVGPTFWERG
jgi:ubiquinol-cytochrome c reductase iron-sulfur subunit